jgi:hypothetical protein
MSDVLIVLSIPFAAGRLTGYTCRAYISRRKRRRAREYKPLR